MESIKRRLSILINLIAVVNLNGRKDDCSINLIFLKLLEGLLYFCMLKEIAWFNFLIIYIGVEIEIMVCCRLGKLKLLYSNFCQFCNLGYFYRNNHLIKSCSRTSEIL